MSLCFNLASSQLIFNASNDVIKTLRMFIQLTIMQFHKQY